MKREGGRNRRVGKVNVEKSEAHLSRMNCAEQKRIDVLFVECEKRGRAKGLVVEDEGKERKVVKRTWEVVEVG